jgi:chemotaxis protein MotB
MRRRKHAPAHENHERWLVSYADFITLLFAFFVVMFASSQQDKQKAQAISDSVQAAMESGGMSAIRNILGDKSAAARPVTAIAVQPQPQPEIPGSYEADLAHSLEHLNRVLKQDVADGKIDVSFQHRGIVISLRAAAFFPSGDDHIDGTMRASIEKIAAVLKELPNPVRLEGHTDAVPIHNARYRSNWELSAARAISVMELLTQYGLSPQRVVIAGFADNQPVDSNDSEAGRAHNRRVDIVVLSGRAAVDEKQSRAATPAAAPALPAAKH